MNDADFPRTCILCGDEHPAFRGVFEPEPAWSARHDPGRDEPAVFAYSLCLACSLDDRALRLIEARIARDLRSDRTASPA